MRSAVAGLSGLLAALLLPLALVSLWLHMVVADPGEYLARVDPLAAEQRVQAAVEEVLVDGVLQRVDLAALEGAGGGDAAAAAAAEALVRRVVRAVVESDAFASLWRTAQQAGHSEVVSALSSPDPVRAGARIVVPLDAFVDAVRDQLAGLGLQLQGALDGVSLALPLATADDLEHVRVGYQVLEGLWLVLPLAAGVLAVAAVALARRRLGTLGLLGLLAAVVCVVLLAVLGLGRRALLDASPTGAARVITGRMADAVSRDLRDAAVTGVLVGVGVLVLAMALGLLVRGGRRLRRTVGG